MRAVRIAILVEGKTETAFKPYLISYLEKQLAGRMPKLVIQKYDGRIPSGEKLKRIVENLLNDPKNPADAVIALTDVYTGPIPLVFSTAAEAKKKMRDWVGPEKKFHPHVALHDFEAWLLPYWERITKLTGTNRKAPRGSPEKVNHDNPPSRLLEEVFRTGSKKIGYVKARDAGRILKGQDLCLAIDACPELKAFVDRIIELCG